MHRLLTGLQLLKKPTRIQSSLLSLPSKWAAQRSYRRDSFDYSRVLRSCSTAQTLKQAHAQTIVSGNGDNPFLAAKIVSQYADLGALGDARKVFDQTPQRDVLLWNVMIRAYSNSCSPREAVATYADMKLSAVRANCYTFPFAFKACSALGDECRGRVVHAHAVRDGLHSDLCVGNALVAFYARCSDIVIARRVFDGMPVRDLVSWNSMIAGYSQNDYAQEAVLLLHQMLQHSTVNSPDRVTLVAVLPSCAAVAAIREGMWVHSYALKTGMGVDAGIGCGLIGMYANCGRLTTARTVFNTVCDKNHFVFNSMIRAYGMHGHASEALAVFSEMLEMGVQPDSICFLCVLSACSHAGMADKGWEVFEMMGKYGVEKSQVHYACMVDLMGRAGKLSDAVEFIKDMPVMPDKDVWGALLGACRVHNNVELAEEVAKRLFLLDPENAGRYAILAKMYEDVGRWEDAARVRKAMRDRGVRKPLGCSMVEVDNEVYSFGVEDESNSMKDEIYNLMNLLERVVAEQEVEAVMV